LGAEMAFAEISDGRMTQQGGGVPDVVETYILSLPDIHCAGCISKIEKVIAKEPEVISVRVNLTLKRVTVHTGRGVTADHLIKTIGNLGYKARELDAGYLSDEASKARDKGLLMRLAVAGFAAMNVMLLSVAVWSGATDATRDMMHWVSAAIALPAIAFAAQPFFNNAYGALAVRRLNMDVPISLAIVLAGAMSLYETSQGGAHAYFDAALSLTFFLLAGRYLDHRTRASARSAAQELTALEVARATKITDGKKETVPLDSLMLGDTILVNPGGRIPVDGVIQFGDSEVDRAFLTGESAPVYAGRKSKVHAGEINLTGPLTIEVSAVARDSALQQLAELVAVAENARTKYTSLADRAAAVYAPGVHILAALALVGWLLISGDLRLSVNIAIAVLIITCPCALGLAVPAVTTAASGRLFRRGVLLKSGTALERLAEIDTVVFDKTGTLTLGELIIDGLENCRPADIALAAALGTGSNHPMARALVDAADGLHLVLPKVGDIKEHPGFGIAGRLENQDIRLGRALWVKGTQSDSSATFLKRGDEPAVCFKFTDKIRPGAVEVVRDLNSHGIHIKLLSGDTQHAVAQLAREVGIEDFTAEISPKQKAGEIANLQSDGCKVLMVGDGLNDTAALRVAHVSMSPASAIDAARVASDIVLLGRNLTALGECLRTAKSARRRIKENFTFAALYNLVAVPIALAGFATPLIAALAMSASSITVTLNAWRVRL